MRIRIRWRWPIAVFFSLIIVGMTIVLLPYVFPAIKDPASPNGATYIGAIVGLIGLIGLPASGIRAALRAHNPQELLESLCPRLNKDLAHSLELLRFGAPESLQLRFRDRATNAPMTVDSLAPEFGRPPVRLVIVGPSGAGKTYAGTELALKINTAGIGLLSLVISATRWDGAGGSMHAWLGRYLEKEFAISHRSAERLLQERAVVPIFDGLDELLSDSNRNDTNGIASLMGALLDWVETAQFASFVVTSQPYAVRQLPDRLKEHYSLKVLEWVPTPINDIDQFVARRLVGRDTAPVAGTLRQVVVPDERNVLQRTAWRTAMLVRLAQSRLSPDETLDSRFVASLSAASERQLVAAFVHSTVESRKTALARTLGYLDLWWLGGYARYLVANADERRQIDGRLLPTRDLELHRLWPSAGTYRPRAVDAALCTLLSAPGFWWLFPFVWDRGWIARIAALGGCALWVLMLLRTSTKAWVPAARPDWARLSQWRLFVPQTLVATLIGIVAGVSFALPIGLAAFATTWLVVGLTVGFGQTLSSDSQAHVVGPYGTLENERRVSRLAAWIVFPVLLLGFASSYGSTIGSLAALSYAFLVGETVACALWRRYISMILAAPIRCSPSPRRLFERAHRSGLMRVSSMAYQFRHDEIRDYLASLRGGPFALIRGRKVLSGDDFFA